MALDPGRLLTVTHRIHMIAESTLERVKVEGILLSDRLSCGRVALSNLVIKRRPYVGGTSTSANAISGSVATRITDDRSI
jgi:hypothetical protein